LIGKLTFIRIDMDKQNSYNVIITNLT